MHIIGFLINPVAGLGGTVGLKGTDNLAEDALRRGAIPRATVRAEEMLQLLEKDDLLFLTCEGLMGADSLNAAGNFDFRSVYTPKYPTSAEDTRHACRAFLENGAELIVFCGGDGTARDVFDAVGTDVPILGIPAGVKMYSAVFAITPAAAAGMIGRFDELSLTDAEVMDVDEKAYREGRLSTKLYGYARVPSLPVVRQQCKWVAEGTDGDRIRREIARFICEIMREDILYILGAGTTTRQIADQLGLEKTLLGIDAVLAGRLVGRDLNETGLLKLLEKHPRSKIIISPIGAQGFVLGRGNQQISPAVINKAGPENLIVVATPEKLEKTPVLYIDTGNEDLNRSFGDSIAVISGYRMAQRKKLIYS